MHLVLYQQDMNMCQIEKHMEDIGNKWSVAIVRRFTINEARTKPYFQW